MVTKAALDGIDKINWAELIHAYGPAEDVPDLLKALASDDQAQRENAFYELYGNIFHQGTRYQATPKAIPFIVNILESQESAEAKIELIHLLVNLALGYPESFLPHGLSPRKVREEVKRIIEEMSEDDERDSNEFGFHPQYDLDCYEELNKRTHVFVSQLKDDSPELKIAAAYALAWFPEAHEKSVPLLRELINSHIEAVSIVSILAFGLIANNCVSNGQHLPPDIEVVLKDLNLLLNNTQASLPVRFAAAIATSGSGISKESLDVILLGLNSEEVRESSEGNPFNDGNLVGYASSLLSQTKDDRDVVINSLCVALSQANTHACIDITSALLYLVMVQQDSLQPLPKSEKELSAHQRAALQAIAKCNGWQFGDMIFANFSNLVSGFGIPSSKDELRKYLHL